jgi:hypothetical protein
VTVELFTMCLSATLRCIIRSSANRPSYTSSAQDDGSAYLGPPLQQLFRDHYRIHLQPLRPLQGAPGSSNSGGQWSGGQGGRSGSSPSAFPAVCTDEQGRQHGIWHGRFTALPPSLMQSVKASKAASSSSTNPSSDSLPVDEFLFTILDHEVAELGR